MCVHMSSASVCEGWMRAFQSIGCRDVDEGELSVHHTIIYDGL
jgi:hypothetical protein